MSDLQQKYNDLKHKYEEVISSITRPLTNAACSLENHIDLAKHQSMTKEDKEVWKIYLESRKMDLIKMADKLCV